MANEERGVAVQAKDVLLGVLASTLGSGPDLVNTIRPGTMTYGTSARAREMLGVPQHMSDSEEAMVLVGSLASGLAGLSTVAGIKIAQHARKALTNAEWRRLVADAAELTAKRTARVEKETQDMITRVHNTLFEAGKGSGKGYARHPQVPIEGNVFPYGILRVADNTPGQEVIDNLRRGLGRSPIPIPETLKKELFYDIRKGLNKPHAAEISRQAANNNGIRGLLSPSETVPLSSKSYIPSLIYDTLGPGGRPTKTTYQVLDEALKRGLLLNKK